MIEEKALELFNELEGSLDRQVSIHSAANKQDNRFRVAVQFRKPVVDIVQLSGVIKLAVEKNVNITVEIKDGTLTFR